MEIQFTARLSKVTGRNDALCRCSGDFKLAFCRFACSWLQPSQLGWRISWLQVPDAGFTTAQAIEISIAIDPSKLDSTSYEQLEAIAFIVQWYGGEGGHPTSVKT